MTRPDNNIKYIKKYDRTSVRIYIIIVIAILLTDVILADRNKVQRTDIFSMALGLVTVFFFYLNSQRILWHNNFKTYFLFGLVVFVAALTKELVTGFYFVSLFLAGLPIIFVLYFRGLVALFFKGYPDRSDKPTIVFASQYSGSAYYDGKEEGYKPTIKEKVFSLLLFMGFIFFIFGLLWLSKKFLNVM